MKSEIIMRWVIQIIEVGAIYVLGPEQKREMVEEMTERREFCRSTHGTTVSLEMKQDIDGQFW
eukprot:8865978-Karenia_brevis.AAC.1